MKKLRTIDVNKKVIITNEYPGNLGRFNSETVLNITAKDGDNTDGFVQAVFAFEDEGQCCEHYGVHYSENLFGEYYVKSIHVFENDNYLLGVDSVYGDDSFGELIVVVETLLGKYDWRCFNEHNGYYAHEVSVEVLEDGRKTFEYDTYY